jgi:F-type H+-transporting ATPase subunit b
MGALGITLPGLLTQLISFTLLMLVLYRFLYGPIVRMLDQRAERIKNSLEAAENARAEAASSAAAVEQEMVKARQEGQRLIAEAQEAARRAGEQIAERSRQQGEEIIARAESEITQQRDAAIEDLRREFAGLAVLAAERVVERELDAARHQELIDRVLEEGLSNRNN